MPTGELSLIFMLLGPYGVVPVALQLGALGCVARAHGAVVVATATSKSVLISELISVLISVLMSVLMAALLSVLISVLISVPDICTDTSTVCYVTRYTWFYNFGTLRN